MVNSTANAVVRLGTSPNSRLLVAPQDFGQSTAGSLVSDQCIFCRDTMVHLLQLPHAVAFPQCSCCSDTILNLYKTEGFAFLRRAFNDPNYLEEASGLAALQVGLIIIFRTIFQL